MLCGRVAFSQSIQVLNQKLSDTRDSLEIVEIHFKIGKQCFKDADFVAALEHFFKALRVAEKTKNEFQVASACNNISTAYMETGKYEAAEKYAQKAITLFTKQKADKELGNAYNSLANTYYMQEKDSLALHFYQQSIRHRKIANDSAGLFAAYKNIGAIYHALDDTLKSIEYMEQCLQYLTEKDDSLRWFSAYMTLGEVYVYIGQLEKGKAYLEKSAKYLPAVKAYHKLDDYHHALYRYYYSKEDYEQAFEEYVKYEECKDSVENIEKSRQLLELNVLYETEKKEQENKLLQQQNELKQLILLIVIVVFFLFVAVMLWLFNRNNLKKKQNELLMLQNQQKEKERIARDLHDNVGGQLSYIIYSLDGINDQDETRRSEVTESISQSVRSVIGSLRETIWAISDANISVQDFSDKLKVFTRSLFQHKNVKIHFIESVNSHRELNALLGLNLYRICQEILNNAFKYANATEVNIDLKSEEEKLIITLSDNGIGFDVSQENKESYGLQNIRKRAAEFGIAISLETKKGSGTKYVLVV